MPASYHKGPVPIQEYPIKTPSLRSLAPKDKEERKQRKNEKSTLKLFGLDEGTFASPAVPRIDGDPNPLRLLAPPNVNAAPPPVRKKAPVITVREQAAAAAPVRQRPSIAWLAFAITLLTFGWWVLFRSPPSTTATAPAATSPSATAPVAVNAANRSAGKPAANDSRAGTAVAAPPAGQPQAVAAFSVPSNEQAAAQPDAKVAPTPSTSTARSAKSASSGTASSAPSASTAKSSLVAKIPTTPKSKSGASAPKQASGSAAFDANAARSALAAAAASASSCRQLGDPAGTVKVMVTFAPSGRVTSSVLAGGVFSGTRAGGCIAARMRSAKIPPFSGSPVTVSKSLAIR